MVLPHGIVTMPMLLAIQGTHQSAAHQALCPGKKRIRSEAVMHARMAKPPEATQTRVEPNGETPRSRKSKLCWYGRLFASMRVKPEKAKSQEMGSFKHSMN